jgi:hypothetical protein
MANTVLGEARPGSVRLRSSGGMPILEEDYHFTVRSDNKLNSRLNIITTAGLPVVGSTVSAFGYTVCKSKSATRDPKSPLIWDVVCTFSSEVDEKQNNQDPRTDPETWIPLYETKFERIQENVTTDLAGVAIANSAGQPFENGMTVTRKLTVWEFFQIEAATITDEQIADRSEVVNNATFKGRPAWTLKLDVLSSVVGFYYGARRRLTQYQIVINKKNWKQKRLDVGTVYLDGGSHKPYLDNEGNVILGGLNGSGAKVSAGSPPTVREFENMEAINFSAFLRV